METASVVFEHKFDKAMLEQIETLRAIRLNLTENMLKDLPGTTEELSARGLIDQGDRAAMDELKKELTDKVKVLRDRLKHPDIIFADEISFYVELLDGDGVDDDLEPLSE